MMKNKEAKSLVADVFCKIRSAKSVNDFDEIVDTNPILKKNKFDPSKYPDLEMNISTNDIANLKDSAILSDDNKILPLEG